MTTIGPVPLFDGNVFVGPLGQRPPGAPEDVDALITTMAEFGLQQALVTHTVAKWHHAPTGNARLMRELSGHQRLLPCWVVMPSSTGETPPEIDQVAQLLASGARAARLCPTANRIRLEPWVIDPLLAALAERRVPLLLDFDTVRWNEDLPWAAIERAARAHPTLPLVLVRPGHGDFRTLFPLLDHCQNIYLETSYLQGQDAIRLVAERWGAHRLLFGTGLPVWDPALPITGLSYAGLQPDDLQAVARDTLGHLLEGCAL